MVIVMINELLNLINIDDKSFAIIAVVFVLLRIVIGLITVKLAFENKWSVVYWIIAAIIFGNFAFLCALIIDSNNQKAIKK